MSPRKTGRKRTAAQRRGRRKEQRVLARGRRGRPTQEEVAAINSAVIEIARAMFLEEGYSATAMEAVAKRSGVSKATLYGRFPTKEALFAAVVTAQVAEWSDAAKQHDDELATKSSLRERLEHHAIVFLDSGADPRVEAFGRLLFAEARRFPEISRIYHEVANEFAINLLVREIENAAERDGVPVQDARQAALALADSLSGWSTRNSMLNVQTSPRERRRAAQYKVRAFMAGRAGW